VSEGATNQVMTYETGTIRSVRAVAVQSQTDSAVGTLLGAAAGAALGHMVGSGHGKDLATIGGGLAGAYVGNQVSRANASELTIRTDKGRTIVIVVKGTGYYPGERVRIVKNGSQVASVEPL
jgi:outer membrane lipoprotein SlyB